MEWLHGKKRYSSKAGLPGSSFSFYIWIGDELNVGKLCYNFWGKKNNHKIRALYINTESYVRVCAIASVLSGSFHFGRSRDKPTTAGTAPFVCPALKTKIFSWPRK